MRWIPTISFSTSNSSSSSNDVVDHRKKVWRFGNPRKATRLKKLCQVAEHEARSPPTTPRWRDSDEDAAVLRSHSPTGAGIRTSVSVVPQPLPLPEISSAAASALRRRDGECPLPSPMEANAGGAVDTDGAASTSNRIRSAFSRQDARKNIEPAETRSSRIVHQDLSGSESTRDNYCVSVPAMSATTSPFLSPSISPLKMRNGDFVPYYYVTNTGNQFWSAPEMPTSEAAMPPPAFFDLSALGNETSPHQSPRGKSLLQHLKCSSGPPSPMHSVLPNETTGARRESTSVPVSVHPLPLPPGASLVSPSATATFPQAVAKSESVPMTSQWQKGKLIGRGTFGSVYVATNRETGALCAMKEVEIFPDDPKSAECIKQLEQEIKVLSQLEHSNIVQYYGSEIVEDRFYIYLEYVHPGSINKYVHEHCGAITESVIRNFTRHILSGLAYLHSKKTIHRDIKGANLLVDSAGVVKLADFGMAKHLTGYESNLSLRGSPYWMAPELMNPAMQKDNNSDLPYAIDIWSLGCTIIEMFTGKPPWSEYEGAAAMFKVMKDTPPIPEKLSSEGKDFLRCCFKRNPADRPTAAALLEHRFLKFTQQPEATSSTPLYNGTSFMDNPPSPKGQYENKPDQLSPLYARGEAAARRGFLIPSLDIPPAYWEL